MGISAGRASDDAFSDVVGVKNALQGGILLGRISHIAVWGMSPIAYGVAYAIRAAEEIAGAT